MRLTILENRADMIVLRVKNADSNRDLQRSDKRDIEYKGMLYDVLREVRQGSSTVFICFHDSKEESLFKGLNKAHFHKIYLALWDHVIKVAFPEQPVNVNNTTFSNLQAGTTYNIIQKDANACLSPIASTSLIAAPIVPAIPFLSFPCLT